MRMGSSCDSSFVVRHGPIRDLQTMNRYEKQGTAGFHHREPRLHRQTAVTHALC